MAERLRSLEWCRFTYGGHTWRVILTTPQLAPSFCEELRRGDHEAVCHYEAQTIYVDAGGSDDALAERLLHELHHVYGPQHGDGAHRFFSDAVPLVVSIYKSIGISLLPPRPGGWERLHRSSKRWHAKQEWSK
jgi:hypothetical protein